MVALARSPFDKAQNSLPRPDRDLENDGDSEQYLDLLRHWMRRVGEPVDNRVTDEVHHRPQAQGPQKELEQDGRAILRYEHELVSKLAGQAVLATGAAERPIAFRNNDRPGIMLAGAVRRYVTQYGVAPGQQVAVFANSDEGARTVADLQAAGVKVVALIDARKDSKATEGVAHFAGSVVTDTRGRLGLKSITIRNAKGAEQVIEADCLALSGGWNPNVHLTCHQNARPVWQDDIAGFVAPEGAVPGLKAVGAAAGDYSTHAALSGGLTAAQAAYGAATTTVVTATQRTRIARRCLARGVGCSFFTSGALLH